MAVNYFSLYAIKLMSCVLNNSAPVMPDEEIDWFAFKIFCDRHSISNIVAYGINKLDMPLPDDIKSYFSEIVLQSAAKEARVEVETIELADAFEKNNIPHMLLKGSVIKNYYPQPDMRSMCDVDILVGKHLDEAMEVMQAHGFELRSRGFLHDCYFKKPFINVELHSSLFDEELTQLYDYFKIGFERAQLKEGFSSKYELSKEDFYIFILTHLAKHFKRTGTGIRSVADIYVYLVNNPNLNFEYVNTELEKIGLRRFSEKIKCVAFSWFSDGNINSEDAVENYIITSGTYGSNLNLELNRFLQNDNGKSYTANKIKYIFNVAFPNMSYMCARYPQLKKRPVLLPFYWIKRIVHTIFKSNGSIKYRLVKVAESDKSYLDKFSDFD